MSVLRFATRPVLRPVFSFRLYVHRSLFIRAVASRRRRFSSIQSSPLASLRRTLRSLPRCLIRFAHPSRPSSRLASRRSSRSHAVSLCLSVLISFRLARCAARLPSVLLSRRFVQLISSLSPCFAVLAVLAASCPDDAGRARTPHNGFVASK